MITFLLGAAASIAATAAGYQSMAPTGKWYGDTFSGLRRGSKKLALTFDDGPSATNTPRLLETLAKHEVRATFFLIGLHVQQYPQIVRELVQAGHVIGNHTFTHPNLIFASSRQTRMQIQECERVLADTVGEHSNLFRPPFGGRRPRSLRIARELGLIPVMWNVTAYDWNSNGAEKIQANIAGQVRGGDVILLHDGSHSSMTADRSATIVATERVIQKYKSAGYTFVTIPEMLASAAHA